MSHIIRFPLIVALLGACAPTAYDTSPGGRSEGLGAETKDDAAGEASESVTAEFCAAMDDCNNLDGISVAECVEMFDACLADHLYSEQQDWTYEIVQCMDLQTCGEFIDCYWEDVPYC